MLPMSISLAIQDTGYTSMNFPSGPRGLSLRENTTPPPHALPDKEFLDIHSENLQSYKHSQKNPSATKLHIHTNVSLRTVIRLVESPLTGKTLAGAVKEYSKYGLGNYEEQDSGKECFAEAMKEALFLWTKDKAIHFLVQRKSRARDKLSEYFLADTEQGVLIGRRNASGWLNWLSSFKQVHIVRGVTLSELQAHSWKNDLPQTIVEAQNGDEVAQRQLGLLYESGFNVCHVVSDDVLKTVKNNCQSPCHFEIMEKAQAGGVDAQYQLGLLYKEGVVLGLDNESAFSWFAKAASAGNTEAHLQCGLMLERGIGCKPDQVKANQHFKIAGKTGNALAKCYSILEDIKKKVVALHIEDRSKAVQIKNGCVPARFINAWIRWNASDRTRKNGLGKTMDVMLNLAYLGYAPAQYTFGIRCHGETKLARRCIEYAAVQGYAPAQYQLGLILDKIPDHTPASRQWLRKAACQQYPPAMTLINNTDNFMYFMYIATAGEFFLPKELVGLVASYYSSLRTQKPPANTWFDEMVSLIQWDNHGFKRDF